MIKKSDEKRANPRYDAEVNIQFEYRYDMQTHVEYQYKNKAEENQSKKYLARSKNISSQGVSFYTARELNNGDELIIDIFMPDMNESINMGGYVRWCKENEDQREGDFNYIAGIEVTEVRGQPVMDTVYYDEHYHVYWSLVLEAVLGSYRINSQKRKS